MKRYTWKHRLLLLILLLLVGLIGLMLSKTARSVAPEFTPEVIASAGARYVSGGVGVEASQYMQSIAKAYPLEVVFIQRRTEQQPSEYDEAAHKEGYLAGVKVQIQDQHLQTVLNTVTDGPYLLVELIPPMWDAGLYLVTADYKGETKQQWVYINNKKHQQVIFWWPMGD